MTLLPWFIVSLLVAINALYVAAEFAAVAVERSQLAALARDGNPRAARLLALLDDGVQLDRYIAACQIGITFSSLVAGAYGQATIARELAPLIEQVFGLPPSTAGSAAFFAVLLVLTAYQVVLGELVPKSLALQYPERTALLTYPPTRWSVSLYRGFIWLLNGSGFLLLKPFGITPGGHQHVHSPSEIQLLLAESRRGGALSAAAYRRLERGLQMSARTVRQVMTPRTEVHAIDVSTPPDEVLRRVLDSPYSRLPVYEGTLDLIVGVLNTQDVAGIYAAGGEPPTIAQLLRPVPFVPETLSCHRFVRFLQQQRSSKAIVVDDYGGVQGIISIEDVLGELFGEIGDELKRPEPGAEPLADGTVRLPGTMRVDDAEPWLRARWDGPAVTVGGYILDELGRLPTEGESFELGGVRVTVAEMGPTAVRWVVVKPKASDGRTEPSPTDREEPG